MRRTSFSVGSFNDYKGWKLVCVGGGSSEAYRYV